MDILVKIIQFFLCFTILIGIHEMGHFIMARVFKIRVEKFYIFFDPWFSLFKFKRGNTEYGLGWLPLGGNSPSNRTSSAPNPPGSVFW